MVSGGGLASKEPSEAPVAVPGEASALEGGLKIHSGPHGLYCRFGFQFARVWELGYARNHGPKLH